MIYLRRVSGRSMLPALGDKQLVLAIKKKVVRGDVVIAKFAGREVIKRVSSKSKTGYELRGDNQIESVDSREYGKIARNAVIAKVIWPKTRSKY